MDIESDNMGVKTNNKNCGRPLRRWVNDVEIQTGQERET